MKIVPQPGDAVGEGVEAGPRVVSELRTTAFLRPLTSGLCPPTSLSLHIARCASGGDAPGGGEHQQGEGGGYYPA